MAQKNYIMFIELTRMVVQDRADVVLAPIPIYGDSIETPAGELRRIPNFFVNLHSNRTFIFSLNHTMGAKLKTELEKRFPSTRRSLLDEVLV